MDFLIEPHQLLIMPKALKLDITKIHALGIATLLIKVVKLKPVRASIYLHDTMSHAVA